MREALLLDLGAIIFELHRQERREPALPEAKAAELEEVDDEVRALADALDEGRGLPQLTARGLVAACTSCGAIMGVRDRHCPSCGAAARAAPALEGGDEERPALGEADEELKDADLDYDHELEGDDEIEAAEEVGADEGALAARSTTTNGEQPDTQEIPRAPWAAVPNGEQPAAGGRGGAPSGEQPPVGGPGGAPNGERDAGRLPQAGDALVPKAQRTLRACRRLARAWLDERRSGRR